MNPKARKPFLVLGAVVMAGAVAQAQPEPVDPIGALLDAQAKPAPPPAQPRFVRRSSHPMSSSDAFALRQALEAARRGDVDAARGAIGQIGDMVARKIALWALIDARADQLGFEEVDRARRDLVGWPRPGKRQAATERLLETSGKSAGQVVAWFVEGEPQTVQGAMALAGAYRTLGRNQDATALIRRWWRDKSFEVDAQRTLLARFGEVLETDDHVRRADVLLYGPQGPAAGAVVALLPSEHQAAARARMAFRANSGGANDLVAALPAELAASPGIAFEKASYLRRRGLESQAIAELPRFPREMVSPEQADRVWDERYRLVLYALRNGDSRGAYAAAANSGLTVGGDAADAEFYAGWIALTRLKDAQAAGRHFAALERIGSSPITRGRALYWEGRAAEARGETQAAQGYYAEAANHNTTFYGQLAAEKLGMRLNAADEPTITEADRLRFEGMETVQAARVLFELGQRDLFRAFVLHLDDTVPTVQDAALLVDLARGYGDQDTSMKAVRAAAQRGLILPNRGYPTRTPPPVADAPELALVMGITRQESGFDPMVRSHVGARGMMQLMPATAAIVARKVGVPYSPNRLDDPDYNMTLGSTFLGQLVGQFSGSYVMAIAGYNAGPGRPVQWSSFCGDPRGGGSDPIDFIECIPFSETRNYVMRVMEGMQFYRARLNGGSAPITLSADLRRGAYAYAAADGTSAAP